jgi:hypothetical protein
VLIAKEKKSDMEKRTINNSENMQSHVFVRGCQRKINGIVH